MINHFIKVLILFVCCNFSFSLFAQTSFFVSPTGSDKHNGSLKSPFKSIEKARDKARAITKGDIIIYLRQGEYQLSEPLTFTPEDGNELKSLTLCSYPGEKAVVSGGITLSPRWQPFQKEIMRTKIHPAISSIDMLIVDGKIRPLARYPNYDSTAVRFNGVAPDATSPERVKTWKNPEGGYLHAMHAHDWGDFHYRITGKDDAGNLKLEGGWQNNRRSGLSRDNRMVENIFEELDAPGEWYYNASQSYLYYYPMPGEDINKLKFQTPHLKHLVELCGTEQLPVKNICIKGLELTQTTRTFMEKYEPLLRSDWMIYRGGAVFFEGTENCTLHNCTLFNLGGNAVFFSKYNRHSTVSGSHFTKIGASAVCFVGDMSAVRSPSFEYGQSVPAAQLDYTCGPANNNYPANCLVYDNLIHTIGLFEKQITGVELSVCQSITVSHNSIYDTPRAGINVSEGTWGGHLIEHNDVFDTVKETGDHGSFNSWGRDRFWHPNRRMMDSLVQAVPSLILADVTKSVTIRNNRFRCDRGWDIDLDDGSSNYHIYNNLCLNGGIKLREGFYRIVENNIMINNTFHPHVWFKNSGDVFVRNIVMSPYRPIGVNYWGTEIDYNIFTDSLSYQNARKNKTDTHSIVYPVRFVAPEKGNYQVDNNSNELFRLGFKNFPMDNFGVVSPALKSLAKKPQMPVPVITNGNETSEIVEWQGFRIKNLETLGERSATGMDTERGVYVVSLLGFGKALRDFIKSNDTILGVGGIPVNNLKEFEKALRQVDLTVPVEIVLFRNQHQETIVIPGNMVEPIKR